MKKLLVIILFLVTSTIFVGSLLSVSIMNPNMPMKGCLISRLGGSSECFFNTNKGIVAAIEHITSISNLILGIIGIDLSSFVLISLGAASLLFIWNFTQKLFFHLFKQINYPQFIYHNNKAYFPVIPRFLLNWLNQRIRGQIVLLPIRAYNNS